MEMMIKNDSSLDDCMLLMLIAMVVNGDKKFMNYYNVNIRVKTNIKGQKLYIATDINKDEASWEEAAEGLARMIEVQNGKKKNK